MKSPKRFKLNKSSKWIIVARNYTFVRLHKATRGFPPTNISSSTKWQLSDLDPSVSRCHLWQLSLPSSLLCTLLQLRIYTILKHHKRTSLVLVLVVYLLTQWHLPRYPPLLKMHWNTSIQTQTQTQAFKHKHKHSNTNTNTSTNTSIQTQTQAQTQTQTQRQQRLLFICLAWLSGWGFRP